MKYLITGGCGFIGSNLATEVMNRKEELIIFDNLFRSGSEKNLLWLRDQGEFKYYHGDIRNREDIERIIIKEKPDVVFHLSGQVAMTTSIENPRLDFETNTVGTYNLLDSVRKFSPNTCILYSSTNKVYGDLEWTKYEEKPTRYTTPDFPNGFPETISLDFRTPYGCSKGAADQFLLDFYKVFGTKTVVFRHSSMFGGRQYATFDQGWIGWFCSLANKIQKNELKDTFTISGNGKQVRDVLYASDVVNLYFSAAAKIEKIKGNAFNIGGGYKNSLSILELLSVLENELGIKMNYTQLPPRESDQKVFIADIKKAEKLIGWHPLVDKVQGIKKTIEWFKSCGN